jgi:hypothetical protein
MRGLPLKPLSTLLLCYPCGPPLAILKLVARGELLRGR